MISIALACTSEIADFTAGTTAYLISVRWLSAG